MASQKSTIPTSVAPFQYSLNSSVLSSKDSFRFICASVSQVASFHETLISDINFILRSYASDIDEDKKHTNAHNSYKASPIKTLSILVWFCFWLRSVKEICLATSRSLSERFVAFQQYRLVSLENTKLKNDSVNHKTDNGVFRNAIHRLYHDVHYFQNAIRFHIHACMQHSATCTQKESRTFSAAIFKSQMLSSIMREFLIPNPSKCGM